MASNLEPKINRIATAVTSALSALTEKGVTVPEGANVESLAALIESIEAGANVDFSPFKEVVWGTFVPSEDTNQINLVDLCASFPTTIVRYSCYIVALLCISQSKNPRFKVCSAFSTQYISTALNTFSYLNSAGSSIPYQSTSQPSISDGIMSFGSYKLVAGQEYRYIIGA